MEIIELDDEDDFFAEGQIVGSKKAPDDVTKNDGKWNKLKFKVHQFI